MSKTPKSEKSPGFYTPIDIPPPASGKPVMSDTQEKLNKIFAKIKFKPEFADTHGGCPPAYKGGKYVGLTEAKKEAIALIDTATREAELKTDIKWLSCLRSDQARIELEIVKRDLAQLQEQSGGNNG